MRPAVIYARVSSDRQKEELFIVRLDDTSQLGQWRSE
jgi:predicted site-specific integrase-resolvase